jgi:predicted DNA-binding ribbon-helix-helix protein
MEARVSNSILVNSDDAHKGKHSFFRVGGKKTSLRLEPVFWQALKEIAAQHRVYLADLVTAIDRAREDEISLASTLRVFVVMHYRGELKYD